MKHFQYFCSFAVKHGLLFELFLFRNTSIWDIYTVPTIRSIPLPRIKIKLMSIYLVEYF